MQSLFIPVEISLQILKYGNLLKTNIKNTGIIYKYTSPSGQSYLGQSSSPEHRHKSHLSRVKNGSEYPIHRAIRKYGIENIDYSVVEEVSTDLMDEREIYWIDYYDSFKNGYNQTIGGGGTVTWSYSDMKEQSLEYMNYSDFLNDLPLYKAIHSRGLIEELTSHMERQLKQWSYDDLKEEALKYNKLVDFRKNSPNVYGYITKRGLIKELTSHMEKQVKWDYDSLRKLALKYDILKVFIKENLSAYNAISKRKLNKELFSHMKKWDVN